jgi:hypothetical protein
MWIILFLKLVGRLSLPELVEGSLVRRRRAPNRANPAVFAEIGG